MTRKQKKALYRILAGLALLIPSVVLHFAVEGVWAYWLGFGLSVGAWVLCGWHVAVKAVKNIAVSLFLIIITTPAAMPATSIPA